ncbi:MAG TPA: FAD/NAD(P)-binding protein [Actinoplanes sp.]|nr:FAD/NAD(P)-binding protein [Actinoplanes sp.]
MTAPVPYRVRARRVETADTVTLELSNDDRPLPAFRPGQFAMLTAYGIGEVPISLSGGGDSGRLVHTLRSVGAVTAALHACEPGRVVGVRGPFGSEWDVGAARGRDVVVVAGGIGLAPLRPVVEALMARRADFGRVSVLVGARTPADLLYPEDLRRWARRAQVAVIVDRPAEGWTGDVGLVTTLIPRADLDPAGAVAFVCGPEVMMRFVAEALTRRGLTGHEIRVSLERDMRCGAGWCGHCQLGPVLVCRDGPVFRYDSVEPLLRVREL